jgi:hypothetical protein
MGLGLLVAIGPTRTLILGGLAVLGATLLTVAAIGMLAGFVANKIKEAGSMQAINDVMKVVWRSVALITVCMGLGLLVAMGPTRTLILGGLAVLGATLVLTTVLIGLIGFAAKKLKDVEAIKGVKEIITLTLASAGILVVAYGLGYLIQNYGGVDYILYGLGATFITLIAIGLVFGFIGWISKHVVTRSTVTGIFGIILLTFAAMGIIVAANYLGEFVKERYDTILNGLKLTSLTLLGLVGIAWLAGKLLNRAKTGIIALGVMEILALGAMGLYYVLVRLTKFRKESGVEFGEVMTDLGGMSAVVGAVGVLAFVAGKLVADLAVGLLAFGGILLLANKSVDVYGELIGLTKIRKESGVEFGEVMTDLCGMSAVVGAVGALAGVAGLFSVAIAAGSLAMLPAIEMAKRSIDLTRELVNLDLLLEKNNVSWDDLRKDANGLRKVVREFRYVAEAFGLVGPLVARGSRGANATIEMANKVIDVTSKLSSVSYEIKKAGGYEQLVKTVSVDIKNIMKTFNAKNFSVDSSFSKMKDIDKQYKKIAEVVSGVVTVVDAISKISKVCGVVTPDGLRPIKKIDPTTGEPEYGEPVDIILIAETMTGSVKKFVENLSFGMENVQSMYNAQDIFKIFAIIVDPMTKFVDMLMKYDVGDGNKLCSVTIDSNGTVRKLGEINVVGVAQNVAGAVGEFVNALYDKDNIANWSEIIYGDRTFFQRFLGRKSEKATAAGEMMNVFSMIVDPVCGFVDMLMGLNPTSNGLSKITYDVEGNLKEGKPVNVKETATLISTLIGTFIDKIYGKEGLIGKSNEIDSSLIENMLKPINSVIKISEDLSKESISSELVQKNSLAISSAFSSLLNMDVDPTVMNSCIYPLDNMVRIGKSMGGSIDGNKIISNSKSIVTFMTDVVEKKFPKNTDNINKLTSSVRGLNTAFKNLDNILIKDEERRQKALDKFGESVKNIMMSFDGSQESMGTFKDLLDRIQNLDLTRLEMATTANYQSVPQQTTTSNGGGGDNNVNVNQNVVSSQQAPSITKDDIISAINEVFSTLHITPNVSGISDSDNIGNVLMGLGYDFIGGAPS